MVLQIKKSFGYKNRCEKKRKSFLKKLKRNKSKEIIYLDECGFRNNEACQYGWADKKSRLYALKEGSQHKCLNIIGGLKNGKLIAPFSFEGSCDASVFNVYVETILQPFMNKKTVLVLDNASFHKASNIEIIAKKNGTKVFYLPPYSPDLNPIEHYWHKVKTKVRKYLRDGIETISKAVDRFFREGK